MYKLVLIINANKFASLATTFRKWGHCTKTEKNVALMAIRPSIVLQNPIYKH